VAYLDRTLFYRDATAIDRHLETCRECPVLLASMRTRREAEQASKTSRMRLAIAAAIASVVIVGGGLWVLRPPTGSQVRQSAPGAQVRQTESARSEVPRSAPATNATALAASSPSAPATREGSPTREPSPTREASAGATPKANPDPPSRADAEPAAPAAARVMWRTRDQIVESSSDGGATWATEHTADRPIRASVFVNADVAWVVGDIGLVLRRTKNGWFGASAPAEGNVTAVKASSPSRATVTLEDGRVFTTANGGVTWMPAP
jgi:type IV secretory pathway VirB10-like protein